MISQIYRFTVEALIKQLETKDNQINQLQSLLYSKIPNQLEMTDIKTDNPEDIKEASQPIVNTQKSLNGGKYSKNKYPLAKPVVFQFRA